MFSEKKLGEQENNCGTLKSIKSNKSIQFKNSNEFERFTYVKENATPSTIAPTTEANEKCCSIM